MIRLIPPVSVPVAPQDVASSVLAAQGAPDSGFVEALRASTGSSRVGLWGSGRAALTEFLAACRTPERDEAVIPAYTCFSVPAAAVRAGLRVRLVDLDPQRLDPEPEEVRAAIGRRTACVVLPHLFARSRSHESLVSAVRTVDAEVRILEDAAQAWPSGAGSTADALLLSFGRGKPLPLGGGGALLHDATVDVSAPKVQRGGWTAAVALVATSILARPAWYRFHRLAPFLGIGDTVYDPEFDRARPFRAWQAALGTRLIARLPDFRRRRTEHARRLLAAIEGNPKCTIPEPARGEGPIRLPILAENSAARDRIIRALDRRGVSATRMYPGTLLDVPALRPHLVEPRAAFPGAQEVASRLFTLPVYPTLRDGQVEEIAAAFRATCAEVLD